MELSLCNENVTMFDLFTLDTFLYSLSLSQSLSNLFTFGHITQEYRFA